MPKQQVGSDDAETERMAEPKKNTFFLSRAITLQVLFGNLLHIIASCILRLEMSKFICLTGFQLSKSDFD